MGLLTKHGGARRKSRPADQRGGAGRGQGRKKSTHAIKAGQNLIAEVSQGENPMILPSAFDVTFKDSHTIILTCDEYKIAIHI